MSALGILAPARVAGGIHVSTTVIVIVAAVALLAGFAIFGWRAPDRSPGADKKKERERIDD
jgi:hypothetical protein